MTAVATLMRKLDPPPSLSVRAKVAAEALVQDVRALALEWSTGSDASMISRQAVADTNAARIALRAAHMLLAEQTATRRIADLLQACLSGMTAGDDFSAHDRDRRLEEAADDVRACAEAVAEKFESEVWS